MKTMPASTLRVALVTGMMLILTACGGGSSGSSSSIVGTTLSGAGIKGVAQYAKVVAQELKADGTVKQQLGTAITDANGHYSLSLPTAYTNGPILLTLSDARNLAQPTTLVCDVTPSCGNKGQYAPGASYPIGGLVMTSLVGKASGSTVTAQITPLTTVAANAAIAVAKSGQSLNESLVNAENAGLGKLVGVSNLLGTEPVNLENSTAVASATTAQRQYAYLAAGIGQLAFTTYAGSPDPLKAALAAFVQSTTSTGQISVNDGGDMTKVSLADLLGAALTQVPKSDTAVLSDLNPISNTDSSATAGTTDATLVDSDGDGVPDYRDKCPNTAPNTKVDPNGCAAGTTHTVTATAGTGGKISPTSATVKDGATTSFTVTPNSGYSIDSVSGCGGSLTGSTYATGAITADCTVTASFLVTSGGAPATYTIGGTVSGLSGTGLVLQNNGTDNLTISTNGTFAFATTIANLDNYNVTVLTQPSNPSQTCSVSNGTGTVGGGNVTTVTVSCVGGSSQQASEDVLYSFTGSDGVQPDAGVIRDSAGNLYGTTSGGGADYEGTVFELTPPSSAGGAYTETVLYSFTGNLDGGQPYTGLIRDSAGNLYGTTSIGGANGSGTVFELTPPTSAGGAYSETVLYPFSSDEGNASGLIRDSAGNLYGTESDGGANLSGTVFKLTPPSSAGGAYTKTVLYSFTDGSDGASPDAGVIQDSAGNLYGTTSIGGANGEGTVFKLTPPSSAGGAYTATVLYSFSLDETSASRLIRDSAGNFYGTTPFYGPQGNGTVFELTPPSSAGGAYTKTVLYSFAGGSDGALSLAGLVRDSAGNLYGTTSEGGANGSGTVFELTPPSSAGAAYTETVLYSFADSPDASAPEVGVIRDGAGNLYGTTVKGGSQDDGAVYKITP